MCEEKRPESKTPDRRYCVVDHANKQGDRNRPNPNRRLIGKLRAGPHGRLQPAARRKQPTAGEGQN